MIFHNCIKCNFLELIPLAEGQLPKIQKYICPECQEVQFIKHSRISCETFSEDMIIVDEKNKTAKMKEE